MEDLDLERCRDLAWLAQPLVRRAVLPSGLRRVRAALAPGGWLIMPIAEADPRTEASEVTRRVEPLHAAPIGGGPTG